MEGAGRGGAGCQRDVSISRECPGRGEGVGSCGGGNAAVRSTPYFGWGECNMKLGGRWHFNKGGYHTREYAPGLLGKVMPVFGEPTDFSGVVELKLDCGVLQIGRA